MKQLFLYDFDGTITKMDSLFDFLRFSSSSGRYFLSMLLFSPLFIAAILGILPNAKVKRWLVSHFLKGKTRAELRTLSLEYRDFIFGEKVMRVRALGSIDENLEKGPVYIVSASLDIWLEDIARYLGVGLICTRAHYENNVFDGSFSTPNCNYEEKPKRVRQEIDLSAFEHIHYYGDSKGDMAMKDVATNFYYKEFSD
jgi:HAD superfamily phosphoserine phosphatase-like hydrolase